MIRDFDSPECPTCTDPGVVPVHIYAGVPVVFQCWSCGTRFTGEGVILWAPEKEAQRANG